MSSFLSNIFPWMGKERAAAAAFRLAPASGSSISSSASKDMINPDQVADIPSAPPEAVRLPLSSHSERKKRTRAPDLVWGINHAINRRDTMKMKSPNDGQDDEDVTSSCSSSKSCSSSNDDEYCMSERPIKWLRAEKRAVPVIAPPPVQKLPDDLLLRCLLYAGGTGDRAAVQSTSRTFRRISNAPAMLRAVDVARLLHDDDTPESAAAKLEPYAAAWNLPALYMLGTIRTYCYPQVEQGISLLKMASSSGYVPAHYSLGLVLRDTAPDEAEYFMRKAVDADYFPALQEVLSDTEMKQKVGLVRTSDVNAEELLGYMDPSCLSRLLCRHYCFAKRLRVANTSHCWNPKCGRWSFRCGHRICNHNGGGGVTTVVVGVSRMKVCSRCCRAKYCSKLCQVYDWRSGRHQTECQYLS